MDYDTLGTKTVAVTIAGLTIAATVLLAGVLTTISVVMGSGGIGITLLGTVAGIVASVIAAVIVGFISTELLGRIVLNNDEIEHLRELND